MWILFVGNFIQLLHALLICLFQYSDRFTPVLLIVSLAGIKVCSPDGKVSTIEMHTQLLPRKKDTSRLCADVVMEKPSCRCACGILPRQSFIPWSSARKVRLSFFFLHDLHPAASRYLLGYRNRKRILYKTTAVCYRC